EGERHLSASRAFERLKSSARRSRFDVAHRPTQSSVGPRGPQATRPAPSTAFWYGSNSTGQMSHSPHEGKGALYGNRSKHSRYQFERIEFRLSQTETTHRRQVGGLRFRQDFRFV